MKRLKIGVIFGGISSEHDVSKVSGTSVIKNLNKEKYDIISIYIDKDGKWYTYEKPLEEIDILDIDADVSNDIKPIDNIEKILKLLQKYRHKKVEIFKIHNLAESKYKSIGKEMRKFSEIKDEDVEKLYSKLKNLNMNVEIIKI